MYNLEIITNLYYNNKININAAARNTGNTTSRQVRKQRVKARNRAYYNRDNTI
jgi:hypothetical protein